MVPDEQVISTERIARAVSTIRHAAGLPVLVDGGQGGATSQLLHLARECEAAGAEGLCVEDTQHPKRNSLGDHPSTLADLDEYVSRMQLLMRSRSSPGFMLVARSEALVTG